MLIICGLAKLSYIIALETGDKWSFILAALSLAPFDSPLISTAVRKPVNKDSENHIAPGAYLILNDGTNSSPAVAHRGENSRHLNLLNLFVALPTRLDTAQNFLTMTSSLQSHFDRYASGIDVDVGNPSYSFAKLFTQEVSRFKIVHFDLSDTGALEIPEGEKMPYDECLRPHLNFCLQIYVFPLRLESRRMS
ncbi:hypothetical protein BS47DRAFT_1399433 [Hydnum rufescens UP504]|uniref:Uncharacterized protein n=1 Tax=Hydnum rufescens UP504 TaxID=1448309 RepID=A0A9P6AIL1_9AGAM|nr:hypothetical protein BS47DRAFT_1399433 [Hydnum rufescens UP504]